MVAYGLLGQTHCNPHQSELIHISHKQNAFFAMECDMSTVD